MNWNPRRISVSQCSGSNYVLELNMGMSAHFKGKRARKQINIK